MATAEKPPEKPERKEIAAGERRRLQLIYVTGTNNVEKASFQYASEMFARCVVGDPPNLIYAQSYLSALHNKFKNNKKGAPLAALKGAGQKMALKKALTKREWDTAFSIAVELLQLNPWDVDTLVKIASIFEEYGETEPQLFYLKAALDVNPKDWVVNRLAAIALGNIGQYSQAISCWHRVEQAKPEDPEALRNISELSIQRSMPKQFLQADKPAEKKPAKAGEAPEEPAPLTPSAEETELEATEKRLRAKIAADPEHEGHYIDLAEFCANHDRYDEAAELAEKALMLAGGGDLRLRERMEDYQIQKMQWQINVAEKRWLKGRSEADEALINELKKEQNSRELEIYAARVERSPGNVTFNFELGLRLKRAKQFDEAIKNLQRALADPARKALVHLELGEAFQHKKIYKLAMTNYEQSLENCGPKDEETKKLALYRGGVLAMHMKDLERADQLLTELAGIDFGYRDVAEQLDKLNERRKDE